jgi:hypothetical protein
MKVLICTVRDKNYEEFIRMAQDGGRDVYVNEETGEYFIKIGGERVWQAPDVKFKYMPSGLYVFENGVPKLVSG